MKINESNIYMKMTVYYKRLVKNENFILIKMTNEPNYFIFTDQMVKFSYNNNNN